MQGVICECGLTVLRLTCATAGAVWQVWLDAVSWLVRLWSGWTLCHGWLCWLYIYRRIYNNIIKEIDLRFDFVISVMVY